MLAIRPTCSANCLSDSRALHDNQERTKENVHRERQNQELGTVIRGEEVTKDNSMRALGMGWLHVNR
jgi:hypothetical protein